MVPQGRPWVEEPIGVRISGKGVLEYDLAGMDRARRRSIRRHRNGNRHMKITLGIVLLFAASSVAVTWLVSVMVYGFDPLTSAAPGGHQPLDRAANHLSRPSRNTANVRSKPSAVLGPVDSPPCSRQRPLRASSLIPSQTGRAMHRPPARVLAPHLGR